jgi:hypothetical protein
VARGITLANLVAFVRGGNNVDEMFVILKDVITALHELKNGIETLQKRVENLENER